MKLLGSSKKEISKDKNSETVSRLDLVDVILVHCNIVSNNHQLDN